MEKQTIESEWLTDQNVCKYFDIKSRATIYRWVNLGLIHRPYKIGGGSTRWSRTQLKEDVERMTSKSGLQAEAE